MSFIFIGWDATNSHAFKYLREYERGKIVIAEKVALKFPPWGFK